MEDILFEECKIFIPLMDRAKCVKVHDGDTLHLATILPHPYGATRFCARLLGVDTPELRSSDSAEKALAREARDIVKNRVLNKVVSVKTSQYDKFGRLLVRITTPNGEDLASLLVQEKVAVQYDGGRKQTVNWNNLLKEHTELKSRSNKVIQDGLVYEAQSHSQN